jgi:hypothetical protein
VADEKLRRDQREGAEGDLEAEVQLLAQRWRAGQLTRARLELAAWAGHKGAHALLGTEAPTPARLLDELEVREAQRWGKEAVVRIAVALAEVGFALAEEAPPEARAAIDAARAWLATPTPAHEVAAREAAQAAQDGIRHHEFRGGALDARDVCQAAASAARAAWAHREGRWAARQASGVLWSLRNAPPESLRQGVRSELTPWALA